MPSHHDKHVLPIGFFQHNSYAIPPSNSSSIISFTSSDIKLMQQSNDVCIQKLIQTIDGPFPDAQDYNLSISVLLLASNSSLNDPSDSNSCKFPSDTQYHLKNFEKINSSNVYFELCIPTFCSIVHIQNSIAELQTVEMQSNAAHQSQSRAKPTASIDPLELDVFFFISILLLGALLISVLLGTLYRNNIILSETPKVVSEGHYIRGLEIVYEVSEENLSDSSYEIPLSRKLRNTSTATDSLLQNPRNVTAKEKILTVLRCFNLVDNWGLLMKSREEYENLKVFDGIKTLLICWIICGLTFSISASQKNLEVFQNFMQESWWALIVAGSLLAADVFFYLSGLLTGFIVLKNLQRYSSNMKTYALALLHRLARLWPTYLVVLMIFWKVIPFLGDGPLWHKYINLAGQCTEVFWKNLLFVDNVLNDENVSCFAWGWYLACNVQMFLISLIVCWTYNMNSRAGKVFTGIIIIGGLSATLAFAFETKEFFALPLEAHIQSFYNFYFNTIVHIAPYFLGMLMGILYKEHTEGNTNMYNFFQGNKRMVWVASLLGVTLMSLMFLYPGALMTGSSKGDILTKIWIALNGFLYVCGFAFLAALWLGGEMKWFTNKLGAKWVRIWGRLSFGMYLLSFVVVQVMERTKDEEDLEEFSVVNRLWTAVLVILVTGIAAICLSLVAEIPFMRIESMIEEKVKVQRREEDRLKLAMGEVQKSPLVPLVLDV